MAWAPVKAQIERRFGGRAQLRMGLNKVGPLISDNGNFILDWHMISTPVKPGLTSVGLTTTQWWETHQDIKLIPGVVETGLFIGLAHSVYFGQLDGSVLVRHKEQLPPEPPAPLTCANPHMVHTAAGATAASNRAEGASAASNRAEGASASSNRAEDGPASSNRAEGAPASSNRAEDGPVSNRAEGGPLFKAEDGASSNCVVSGGSLSGLASGGTPISMEFEGPSSRAAGVPTNLAESGLTRNIGPLHPHGENNNASKDSATPLIDSASANT